MPSPFPGIDPFLESQEWEDFHTSFLVTFREFLQARLPAGYSAGVEKSVYLLLEDDSTGRTRVPDAHVARADTGTVDGGTGAAVATAVLTQPTSLTLPIPDEVRQTRLRIVRTDSQSVVTVIEMLSPWNKKGDGRTAYLEKRYEVLASESHLVELDFLRGGRRLPTREPLPQGEYYVFVCRREQRPRADVFAFGLREPLPAIPIPLADGDADCAIALQEVFDTTFDRAGYRRSLRYGEQLVPALEESDAAWARSRVPSAG